VTAVKDPASAGFLEVIRALRHDEGEGRDRPHQWTVSKRPAAGARHRRSIGHGRLRKRNPSMDDTASDRQADPIKVRVTARAKR